MDQNLNITAAKGGDGGTYLQKTTTVTMIFFGNFETFWVFENRPKFIELIGVYLINIGPCITIVIKSAPGRTQACAQA